MPLLDHFHPPLFPIRHWESFHGYWASAIGEKLNQEVLPPGYFAEMQVHIGSRVEIDVATFDLSARAAARSEGGIATLEPQVWAPPAPALVMPAVFPDEIEIQVFDTATGATLVAAIELISPGNKDRPETRRAFAAKCASYLQQGIGLIIVDIVTDRRANLHDELIRLMGLAEPYLFPAETAIYAVAYRPARRSTGGDQIDLWLSPLAVGQSLRLVPLALRNAATVPVDLEATYTQARHRSRL
jgi:hypothetical protein